MKRSQIRAQPPLEFIPAAFNAGFFRFCQAILPLWLRSQTNIAQIEADHVEVLAELFQQFQQGKIRLLLAFRHPSINDPYSMADLLWKKLPQVAQKNNIPLKFPLHAHFMYDRGIPLWAGSAVGWIYSHLGGIPIQRGKADLVGLRSARNLFLNSNMPLAAAPEGATNGHNEIISPIEPGISQLAFWCVEDLRKAQRDEAVIILPIGIQYFYLTPPWAEIAQLITQLEKECGIASGTTDPSLAQEQLYSRLFGLGEQLLSLMEQFYRDYYQQILPAAPDDQTLSANDRLAFRLQNLLNVALQVAESYFAIPATGSFIDRCRRVEQAGWDLIFREELKATNPLSAVERGLIDRVAEEADLRMWHMRIVETFVAVTGSYVQEKPTVERFAETSLLLWDLVTRIQGGNGLLRPKLGKQSVKITIGDPISVSDRALDYRSHRRQAVVTLSQDLQNHLERLIIH
jgi:hypothetical protein